MTLAQAVILSGSSERRPEHGTVADLMMLSRMRTR
jgi:hypothetical protein